VDEIDEVVVARDEPVPDLLIEVGTRQGVSTANDA
jgi:hypothetical protein